MIIHVVQQGDSVYSVSKKYGVPTQRIIDDNALKDPYWLVIGQAIVVVTDNIKHTVTAGESLYSISRSYGTTISTILKANPNITNPSMIYVGQVIIIPISNSLLRMIDINGYTYPTINKNTLANTLPNLTYISIFCYQARQDGSLNEIPDNVIIQAAQQALVAPLMVVTNIKEDGGFDSDIAHMILTNQQAQNALLNNIVRTLKSKNYSGLNIDFEYIYPYDRQSYNQFLKKVVTILRPLGYSISTAIAPKTSGNQMGLLYEAHDYPAQGALVDYVIIMTYEWGYTYGPAQAVAPLNQIEKVLQYAVSVIPSRKILMGIPNYGYDWTLPFVKGSSARSLSNTAAVNLAISVGAEIKYDVKAQSPFFNYYDNNRLEHIVWFEDARSIKAKLALVNKYNLKGISVWTLTSFFPQMWCVVNSMYNVRKTL